MSGLLRKNVTTIPASFCFADELVKYLLKKCDGNYEALSKYLILLPNRRACRTLQEAFLEQTNGKPILLPRLHPIGDVDEEELLLNYNSPEIENIKPAITPIMRQFLLAQLVAGLPNQGKNMQENMRLAKALGAFMDQIYNENLDLADLPKLIEDSTEDLSQQWEITVQFLKILSESWPAILSERNVIDGADRRRQLINALNNYWKANPPNDPIIAAGSIASIPSTAALLQTIKNLPQGEIILPGLDKNLSKEAWHNIEEGHPQFTLKKLIERLDLERQDIPNLVQTDNKQDEIFEEFISHALAPAEHTHDWQNIHFSVQQKKNLKAKLNDIHLCSCENIEEEAATVSLIVRQKLTQPNHKIIIVTPDRYLGRRIAAQCRRWQIEVDDSSGIPLKETRPGVFLKTLIDTIQSDFAPLPFLSFLKHELNQGHHYTQYRRHVRLIDKYVLRGYRQTELDGYLKILEEKNKKKNFYASPLKDFIAHLKDIFAPLLQFEKGRAYLFETILSAHIDVAERLTMGEANEGQPLLWQGEAGKTMSEFISLLMQDAPHIQDCTIEDYSTLLIEFMEGAAVRPRYGLHPRVAILGLLEARLNAADTIIMAGMNEGTWPPETGHDPWMSRPMSEKYGLAKPERKITLAAHDFVQNICNKQVYLTRSEKQDGVLQIPSRWLQRIETLLNIIGIDPVILEDTEFKAYHAYLVEQEAIAHSLQRPTPTPSIDKRPQKLSVTRIEKWLQDPYAIYAQYILRLNKLDPIGSELNAADRGTILHKIMEEFTKAFPKALPDHAKEEFIKIIKTQLENYFIDKDESAFWYPRLEKLSHWIVDHERQWRQKAQFLTAEAKGEIILTENLDRPFILHGFADRIDLKNDGSLALIDYKSGGYYSKNNMLNGNTPQLGLEALIANKDGFTKSHITNKKVGEIAYWNLSGGNPAGQITTINDQDKIDQLTQDIEENLLGLIKRYEDPDTSYPAIPNIRYAPRYNDYELLERVKEWSVYEDQPEGNAA